MTPETAFALDKEQLVSQIEAYNNAWHVFRESKDYIAFRRDAIVNALRETKAGLQIRLLREHYPLVWLEPDEEADGEALYSVRLGQRISGRRDACHLPKRIAEQYLTTTELTTFTTVPHVQP